MTIIEIIESGNNKIRKEDKSNSVDVKAKMEDGIISDDTQDPCLQEARRKLDFMKMTREEQRAYRDFMVSVYSTQDAFETAKSDGYAEGRAEAFEKFNC